MARANPITPIQLRTGDVHVGAHTTLQNLNTFFRQAESAAATTLAAPSWVKIVDYANGWASFGRFETSYAQLPNGQVVFKGAIALGTIPSVAFTLPQALWPGQDKNFAVESNGAYGKLVITPDGNVTPTVGSNAFFSLDGVGFWPGS